MKKATRAQSTIFRGRVVEVIQKMDADFDIGVELEAFTEDGNTQFALTFPIDHDDEWEQVNNFMVSEGLPKLDDPEAPWSKHTEYEEEDDCITYEFRFGRDDLDRDHLAITAQWVN